MTLDQWIEYGIEHHWCSPPACSTHDLLPMTEDEASEFDDGGDPCLHALRLWPRTD